MGKGYDVFLPEFRNLRQKPAQSDRPLFPGYLFCRFDINNRLPILSLPGIVHIVGFGKRPVPVDDDELESLRVVVNAGLPLQREDRFQLGQPIRIERGPLAGAGGTVVALERHKLIVAITLLQRSVSVELEPEWISPEPPAYGAVRAARTACACGPDENTRRRAEVN
jgi:transcription antitermination factor NusG